VRRQDAYATFGAPQHPTAQDKGVFFSRLGRPEPATTDIDNTEDLKDRRAAKPQSQGTAIHSEEENGRRPAKSLNRRKQRKFEQKEAKLAKVTVLLAKAVLQVTPSIGSPLDFKTPISNKDRYIASARLA
jgi:hypothetical protein